MKLRLGVARALLCAGLCAWHAAFAGAARESAQNNELASSCAACHRTDGRSGDIPPLSGMAESRILQRMAEFRAQTTGGQIMHVVAKALTPEETASLAHYFATTPTHAVHQ